MLSFFFGLSVYFVTLWYFCMAENINCIFFPVKCFCLLAAVWFFTQTPSNLLPSGLICTAGPRDMNGHGMSTIVTKLDCSCTALRELHSSAKRCFCGRRELKSRGCPSDGRGESIETVQWATRRRLRTGPWAPLIALALFAISPTFCC